MDTMLAKPVPSDKFSYLHWQLSCSDQDVQSRTFLAADVIRGAVADPSKSSAHLGCPSGPAHSPEPHLRHWQLLSACPAATHQHAR